MQNGCPIEKQTCEECGRIFWTFHSRLDPKSWTDEAFRKIATIDEDTKKITLKESVSIYDL